MQLSLSLCPNSALELRYKKYICNTSVTGPSSEPKFSHSLLERPKLRDRCWWKGRIALLRKLAAREGSGCVSQDHLQSEVQGESILKGSSREMGGVCTRKGQFVSCSQGHLPALWRLCAETGVSLSVVSRGLQARFLNSERSGERAAWREWFDFVACLKAVWVGLCWSL